jgi:hypothetical protein
MKCYTHTHTRPTSLLLGMNKFLRLLDITFRRDSMNYRPRINKKNSVKVCTKIIINSSDLRNLVPFPSVAGHRTEEIRKFLFLRNLTFCSFNRPGPFYIIIIYSDNTIV